MEPDRALILKDVGGLFPHYPLVSILPAQCCNPSLPATVRYFVDYLPWKWSNPPALQYASVRVTATVQQFPSMEWAQYRTKYPAEFNLTMNDLRYFTRVTKFGNHIIMNSVSRYPDGNGTLCFLWPSGTMVITICFESKEVNEEFLRIYLAKYPSSL
jgi:hypothetical protein